MGYPVEYIISSDIILGYSRSRRNPKFKFLKDMK